jgi:hypothetical protein
MNDLNIVLLSLTRSRRCSYLQYNSFTKDKCAARLGYNSYQMSEISYWLKKRRCYTLPSSKTISAKESPRKILSGVMCGKIP